MELVKEYMKNQDCVIKYMMNPKQFDKFMDILEKREEKQNYQHLIQDMYETETHWSSEADVKSSLRKVDFTQKGEIEAGGVPVISEGKTAYVDTSDTHTAVYAISGMKKSICVFMTTIYCLA